MGELANAPHGSTPERELAALALDVSGWTEDAAFKAVENGALVDAAADRLAMLAMPASKVEPNGMVDGKRGPRTDKLIGALSMIGAKIAPTMSQEQTQVWIAAMCKALSDLPFAFAQKGAEDAIHVPMKFLNEVEGVIREKSKLAEDRHQMATRRLLWLKREIAEAARPKLPPLPPPEPREMTQDHINAMPKPLLLAGLNAGYITQEQFDIATSKDEQERPTNE